MQGQSFLDGYNSALRRIVSDVVRRLGHDDPAAEKARWIVERGNVLAALREICHDFGDNDWPDSLSLADVIEKHLARHLHQARQKGHICIDSPRGFDDDFCLNYA